MKKIEERIKPLVEALNKTNILKTFSSCEGHFTDYGKNEYAEVRFRVSNNFLWKELICNFMKHFSARSLPVELAVNEKQGCILSKISNYWVLTITPLARQKANKIEDTTNAIYLLSKLIQEAKIVEVPWKTKKQK